MFNYFNVTLSSVNEMCINRHLKKDFDRNSCFNDKHSHKWLAFISPVSHPNILVAVLLPCLQQASSHLLQLSHYLENICLWTVWGSGSLQTRWAAASFLTWLQLWVIMCEWRLGNNKVDVSLSVTLPCCWRQWSIVGIVVLQSCAAESGSASFQL